MGCTQSKIENEEAVSRCKDRKQFMKTSVITRNEFAAAHSAYSMALKNTGAALSDYSSSQGGELHDLRPPPSLHHHHPQPNPQPTYQNLPPPPPPLPNFSPSPLKRAATMPEFSIPKPDFRPTTGTDTINEEDNDDENEDEDDVHDDDDGNVGELNHRRRRGQGGSHGGGGGNNDTVAPPPLPSPPHTPPGNPVPPPPPESNWDYFFSMNMPPNLNENDEIKPSDHDEIDGHGYNNNGYQRSEGGGGGESDHTLEVEPQTPEKMSEPEEMTPTPVKKPNKMVHSNTAPPERRQGKGGSNISLLQVLNDLDDHFLKASESAHEVSKMLEATRLHYHSNFADNRGHIDHSARVMRVITWNRSFRGIPNGDNVKDDFDLDEYETHATVLDKLLAWEKKLYDEVKAGELMKHEYQRKVALLNKQKRRGASSESMEKTKAAVSHLHTRYIVDMQSMDSTVSEINRLRDKQLYPKLTDLVDGMAKMWHIMHEHHDKQLHIVVADLRFVDVNHTPKETTEQHHERTIQLWGVVEEWHLQFKKLVGHQKEYIQALNSWLKLNLIPIESSLKDKVSSPPRVIRPAIQALLQAWHEHLENLPAELAENAISSFAAQVKTIKLHQDEEMKLKEKCEETNKEFLKRSRAFDDWYNKYMQKRIPTDGSVDPERTEDPNQKDPVAERQFLVDSLKKRLDEEIEAYQKHCRQGREKSLASLKTHLPELFRAMSEFALSCSDMYKTLQTVPVSQNTTENPT